MRRELYAALHSSFLKVTTCISSYKHLITPATKYKNVFWYSGKIGFIEPQGINGHRRHVPGAPSSGTSRESQAMFRDGTVCVLKKGPVGTWPAGSILGKNSFYRETRAKRSSEPRVAYPEVNVQIRDLVRVVGIVAPFAPRGFSIRGKFVLSIGQAKSSIPAL